MLCPENCGHRALASFSHQAGHAARLRGTSWTVVVSLDAESREETILGSIGASFCIAMPAVERAGGLRGKSASLPSSERDMWASALDVAAKAEKTTVLFAAKAATCLETYICTDGSRRAAPRLIDDDV